LTPASAFKAEREIEETRGEERGGEEVRGDGNYIQSGQRER
jgi:hypothetical protein